MFALPFVLLELLFVLLKPQDLYPQLQMFSPLYTLPSLIILGFFFDSGRFLLAARRIIEAPYARFAVAFLVWCMVTLYRQPAKLTPEGLQLVTSLLVGLGIAHGAQTWKKFYAVVGVMLFLSVFLAFVGVHQHAQPERCFYVEEQDQSQQFYDGRPCETADQCYPTENNPERRYVCEHPGLMSTSSINGRVRFRGILEDPNELSLAIALGVPVSFALFQRKKTALRAVLAAATVGLVAACVVFSQSRGGQLVILAVLGTYFMKRFGFVKGVMVGLVAGIPVLALGGRDSAEAEGSALERTELLQLGIEFVRFNPIFGVGKGQFSSANVAINNLTAHNSYVLCGSELGLPGFLLWSIVMFLAIKTPLSAMRQLEDVPGDDAEMARTWATALLASLVGMTVGVFFLSFAYHPILWIYIGLSGSFYAVVRPQIPNWKVRVSLNEVIGLGFANVTLLGVIYVYARLKVG